MPNKKSILLPLLIQLTWISTLMADPLPCRRAFSVHVTDYICEAAYILGREDAAFRAWLVLKHENVGRPGPDTGFPATTKDSSEMVVYVEAAGDGPGSNRERLYYHTNLFTGPEEGAMKKLLSWRGDLREVFAKLTDRLNDDQKFSDLAEAEQGEILASLKTAGFVFHSDVTKLANFEEIVAPLDSFGVVRFERLSEADDWFRKYQSGSGIENVLWYNRKKKAESERPDLEGGDYCYSPDGSAKEIEGVPICATSRN